MKENNPEHIDQLFNEGLKNAHIEPPAGLWEQIGSQVSAPAPPAGGAGGFMGIKGILVAVATAAVGYVAYQISNSSETTSGVSAQLEQEKASAGKKEQLQKAEELTQQEQTIASNTGTSGVRGEAGILNGATHTGRSDAARFGTAGESTPSTAPHHPLRMEEHRIFENDRGHSNLGSNQGQSGTGRADGPTKNCKGASEFTVNKVGEEGVSITLMGAIKQDVKLSKMRWETGDGALYTTAERIHYYNLDQTRIYRIKCWIMTDEGCMDSLFKEVNFCGSGYAAPQFANVFTPNGDGINDTYFVNADRVQSFKMTVFGTDGQPIYTTIDPQEASGWNGKIGAVDAPEGTYIAKVEYQFPCQEIVSKTIRIQLRR